MRTSNCCAFALPWLMATGLTCPAWAGSFAVNPVQLSVPDDRQGTSLTIKNNDVTPVTVQVQTLAWTQAEGLDQYTPTSSVIVSPPIFTIPPAGSQLVRVGLKDRKAGTAYRLILAEIPKQQSADRQVQVTLRLNLPLYVLAKGGGKPDVSWRAWRKPDGSTFIEGRNQGTRYQQIIELDVQQPTKTVVVSKETGVVLPGASRIWKVASGAPLITGTQFPLIARSSAGATQTRVLLETR